MCQNILDIEYNKNLFRKALTHPSYTKEKGLSFLENYQRLEFFGDAVLKLVSSQVLLEKYPEYDEGKLSKIRSILVSDSTISKIGKNIGIDKKLILAEAEEKQGGRERESNIACAFEAILGAYYLDGKFDIIQKFLNSILVPYIEDIEYNFAKYNAKSVLQEYTQEKTNELPEYVLISEEGPSHKPIFKMQVKYLGKVLSEAKGLTKKEAQQNCAYQACINLGIIEDYNE